MNHFINSVIEKLSQPLPGIRIQLKMAPATRPKGLITPINAKESGVLILLFLEDNHWHTLLIQRAIDGNIHSGQISFPGGKKDKEDDNIESTAIRECFEEIGVKSNLIKVIGKLSSLYIPPSNFHVTPTIAFINSPFNTTISTKEVKEIIKIPLHILFDDNIKTYKNVTTSNNTQLKSPVYLLPNNKIIWGATAMIIAELEYLIKNLL